MNPDGENWAKLREIGGNLGYFGDFLTISGGWEGDGECGESVCGQGNGEMEVWEEGCKE